MYDVELSKLIIQEKKRILDKYGPFVDDNHFLGVIFEEVEEVNAEIKTINLFFESVKNQVFKNELNNKDLYILRNTCIKAIKELIQVSAVLEKHLYLKRD